MQNDLRFKNIYCQTLYCRRFLGREDIRVGIIELKCPQCKQWTVVESKEKHEPIDNSGKQLDNENDMKGQASG